MNYILPAEWYPQSGIQLTWPHVNTDWKPYLYDIQRVYLEMINTISKYEKVLIVSPHVEDVRKEIMSFIPVESQKNILFHECDTNDTWARDHGAITLLPLDSEYLANKQDKNALLLDFQFNGWGKKFPAELDNRISSSIFNHGLFHASIQSNDDFVLEGGSIESDGMGTIMTTSQCLLAPNRNQPLNKAQIEEELKRRLFASHIIWLDYGNLIGDDTDGHIDTIVRFAPNNTLLYMGCDDKNDAQYDDFLALEEQLKQLRTSSGNPYRLLRLPMPSPIYDEGERLPATYANFLIINKAIICPTYAQPSFDQEAQNTISMAFPHHEIIPLDARTIIRQHGSIHCLTMQYPIGVL